MYIPGGGNLAGHFRILPTTSSKQRETVIHFFGQSDSLATVEKLKFNSLYKFYLKEK